MVVDASALVAILVGEKDSANLLARMESTSLRTTSAMAIWEASVAAARVLDVPVKVAEREVMSLLGVLEIGPVAISPGTARLALDAFDRFGKGRHPAALNFGDCFAYACAKELGLPLLFKGQGFALTDIIAA